MQGRFYELTAWTCFGFSLLATTARMASSWTEAAETAKEVAAKALHTVAICMSLARFVLRVRKGRVWWDDWLVLVATVADIVYMLTLWPNVLDAVIEVDGVEFQNAWISTFPCYVVIWVSRISLWMSLARIYPSGHRTRRLSFTLAIVFSVVGILCVIGGVMGCPNTALGTRFRSDICFGLDSLPYLTTYGKIGSAIAIIDVFSDALLVAVPLYLISAFRLPRRRKLVVILFGGGSLLPLSAILSYTIYAWVALSPGSYQDQEKLFDYLLHIATTLALVAANMLVIGTAIYIYIERWKAAHNHGCALPDDQDEANQHLPGSAFDLGELTVISSNYSFSVDDDDLFDQRESTRLFTRSLIVGSRDEVEDHELSLMRRATV